MSLNVPFEWPELPQDDIIIRDVCVLGGGASGTHAAIRLQQEGKSVAVVELKDRLGGMTETYIDPTTQTPVDYGVQAFIDLPVVRDFFAHFDIPLLPVFPPQSPTATIDMTTGQEVLSTVEGNSTAALQRYARELAKYPDLEHGFHLPKDISEDLLMPFGEFVDKYDLAAAVPIIFNFCSAVGYFLQRPAIYILKTFTLPEVQALGGSGFLAVAGPSTSLIYTKAEAELGPNLFLSSRVIAVDRTAKDHVKILITTPDSSTYKIIQTKKLLVSFVPTPENLSGFDLSEDEEGIFSQFSHVAYYSLLVKNTGIPPNLTVSNTGTDTPYHLPASPGSVLYQPTKVPGLINVYFASPVALPQSAIEARIRTELRSAHPVLSSQYGGGGSGSNQSEPEIVEPEIVALGVHAPYELSVGAQAIKDGFYRDLYALQGKKNTFFTGGTWHHWYTSTLWRYNEEKILPAILDCLS